MISSTRSKIPPGGFSSGEKQFGRWAVRVSQNLILTMNAGFQPNQINIAGESG
jgi:hypothetical protein